MIIICFYNILTFKVALQKRPLQNRKWKILRYFFSKITKGRLARERRIFSNQKLSEQNLIFTIENTIMKDSSVLFLNDESQGDLLKKKLNLTLHDFKITKILASGDQSNVYEAESVHYQQKIVLKSFKLSYSNCQYNEFISRVKNQISLNLAIQQASFASLKYFLRFHGYFNQNDAFFLIFQLCTTNYRVFKKLKTYNQKYTLCFILLHDMIEALRILDRLKIVHRDIKPDNILFKNNFFKLADFGLGTFAFGNKKSSNGIGNIFSKSPQAHAKILDTKSDIWSLAVTVFYLLQGRLPFDVETVSMLNSQNMLKKYVDRIKNKEFSICIKDSQRDRKNYFKLFPIFTILRKMLQVQFKQRPIAACIYQEYFKNYSFDESLSSKIFTEMLCPEKVQVKKSEGQLIKYCFFKYLKHREDSLGIYFVVLLVSLCQILKINRKLLKFDVLKENQNISQNQLIIREINLMKNIKISSIKLIEVLNQIIIENQSQKRTETNELTSFGQIQQIAKKTTSIIHQDQLKLKQLIKQFLDISSQLLKSNKKQQKPSIQKHSEEEFHPKSVTFCNVLTCISGNDSKKQIKFVNFNQKSPSKIKCLKKLESLQKDFCGTRLPKSIKYLNDNNQSIENNRKEFLANFLKFYSQDNLQEKFPLLAQNALILRKLVQTQGDPMKRKVFIKQDFKIWNLSLDLYKF